MSGITQRKILRSAAIAVMLAGAVVLAGCGDDDASTAVTAPVADDVANVVETVASSTQVESTVAPPEPAVTEQPAAAVAPAPQNVAPLAQPALVTGTTPEPAAPVADTVAKVTPAPQKAPAPEAEAESKVATRSASHLATINFFEAMLKGDEDQTMTLVHGTEAQKQAVRALTRFQKAGNTFKARFVSTFGEQAWGKFNDPDHLPEPATSARPPFNASVTVFDPRDLEQIRLYQPQENGDVAVYPSEAGDMRLVRQDGKWRVDAATVLPTRDEDPAPAEKMMSDRAIQIDRFAGAIGMDGVSADDIDVELSRALIEASFGIDIPEPHRFDVTKLK